MTEGPGRGSLLSAARTALAAGSVAAIVIVAAGFAVVDQVRFLGETPAESHATAWTASEDLRLRRALLGWYPTVTEVRRAVPESAVVWCWTNRQDSGGIYRRAGEMITVALAPRLCATAPSGSEIEEQLARFQSAGLPVYLLDCHPSFLSPEPVAPGLSREFPEWPVIARHEDFTLHRVLRAR